MSKKLLHSYFGLQFNPFQNGVQTEMFHPPFPDVESFNWKVRQLSEDGGFALISGEPGSGKSVALRQLKKELVQITDLSVELLSRPQSSLRDFYMELGDLYSVSLPKSGTYTAFKDLRNSWLNQLDKRMVRPLLLIDEAQEMQEEVITELRLLTASELDARCLMTVVFAGDQTFKEKLSRPKLAPVLSRIRHSLDLRPYTPPELQSILSHLLKQAGRPNLFDEGVIVALAEGVNGNLRTLTYFANELLVRAMQRELTSVTIDLYLESKGKKKSR